MELNPNHPTTSSIHDHWHKIAAALVNRIPKGKTIVTLMELTKLEGKAITIKETPAGLELRIVSMEEGERLARKEGGLPV